MLPRHQPLTAACPPDPESLTYTVQHQVLGSDQWTVLTTGLREPRWAAMGLRKGLQHVFRVLSSSGKSSSKPSPPSEPVQLLERGEWGAQVDSGLGRHEMGWRLRAALNSITMAEELSGSGPSSSVAAGLGIG